eukprot:767867-Hanusia_phi.AAC.9
MADAIVGDIKGTVTQDVGLPGDLQGCFAPAAAPACGAFPGLEIADFNPPEAFRKGPRPAGRQQEGERNSDRGRGARQPGKPNSRPPASSRRATATASGQGQRVDRASERA